MAKRENIICAYDRAAEQLFTDKTSFAEYLEFSGRFYKMPSSQVIMLFDDNPNATMVADYDTWKRFGRKIKPGGWSTDVLEDGKVKRLFDISMTKGDKTPYQWVLNKNTAEKFVEQLSNTENRNFTGMSDCIYHLAVSSVMERIEDVKSSLNIIDINIDDEAAFRKSFASMVRRVVAARCEWNSDFTYGGTGAAKRVDLSALDMLDNSSDMETLLEEVQITAKKVLKSMEKSINDIIFERSIDNERNERTYGTRGNDVGRGSSQGMVRGGEEIPPVDNDAQREDVQTERGDVRVRSDDGAVLDERGAGTDESSDKPLGQGMAEIYDGELPVRYPEAARETSLGSDTAQDRQGSVGDHGENAGGISDDEPAPNVGERNGLGGAAQNVDAGADIGKFGERSEDGTVISENDENTLTTENSSAVNYLSLRIAELSDAFVQKYDSDYKEFTLANYAFNYALTHTDREYDLPEYDLNLSIRDNVEKMLRDGQHSYLKEYLDAIFKEAFEGRVIVDEGTTAGEIISQLAKLRTPKTEKTPVRSEDGEQLRLFPEPLDKKQQAELDRLTKNLTNEFEIWEHIFLDGSTDAIYEDGVGLALTRNHILHDKYELEEKFPENLPEVYYKETPPEYPNNYQSVKKGDTLRFEYGDFLVLSIEKTNEYSGEYTVQLQDKNGEIITQNLRDIKTKFQNLTNRGEVPSREDVQDITGISSDLDKFYVDKENERVTWVYFNPDSDAGGQLVYNRFTFDDIFDAIPRNDVSDYLESVSRQETVDITAPNFEVSAREFLRNTEDFNSRDNAYLDKLAALTEPYYYIFQLKNEQQSRDYRFAGMSELRERGLYIDRENYVRVYRERIQNNETLDDIFTKFNVNIPADFRGHSLSVGDVIGVRRDGKPTAYYVDSAGFTEIPDWLLSREERKARRTLTDNLVLIAENQLASDEMDTLGDKLFDYENAPHYKGNGSDWLIGNGTTADKFEEITTRYHNGEDVRAELAKGMYTDNDKLGVIEFFDDKDGIDYVNIETSHDERGMAFKTKGGFEITYSWEQLGGAMITAARKEFDRHEALNKAYREDGEKYGNLYLALRDGRTVYLNRADDSNKTHTNYRLESGEEHTIEIGSGVKYHSTLFVADDKNGERVQLNDFGSGNYYNIIHTLLENGVRGHYEVSSIEREPIFKVETGNAIDGEANLKSYIKSNGDLLPGEILYSGSAKDCEKYAEWLRLGGNSQAEIKGIYRAKLDEEHTVSENVSQGDFSRLVKDEDTIFDWSKYAALGVHSAFERIIHEKNVNIDTNVIVSLSPKAEDLSDYALEIGIKPCVQGNQLYYAIGYNLRNEKTEKITEVGSYFVDTDGVMNAGHSEHLPNYETFRTMVEVKAAKAVDKIREMLKQESEQSITITDVPPENALKQDITSDTLIPFLEKNSVLTAEERKIIDEFKAKNPIRTFSDVKNVAPKSLTAEKSGDFYEFYGEDARLVADVLGLHITSENHRDMTEFPSYKFGDYAEKLAQYGYVLLDGAALAEERLKESAEKIKAAHEQTARLNAAFDVISENTELNEKQKQFLERAKRAMEINGFEHLGEVFGAHAFRASYGTPENIYKLFGGEDKFRDIEKSIDDVLSGKENVSHQTPKYNVEYTSDAFEEPFIIRNNDASEDSPDRYYDIDGIYQTFETEKAAQEYADKLNSASEPTLERVSPVTQIPEEDYRIEETEQTAFGPKTRYAANVAAIKTLNQIESENRTATPDEQEILAQYVGWGGIPQAFDSDNAAWSAEYSELKELLTSDEYEAARSTVLTAHYTSPTIILAIYSALDKFGFKGGNVLEPAMGIGNFFGVMPEEMRSQSQLHGVELDDISGRIAKQLYPNADIQICGYENTAFSDNFFDAAVGNVPFGNYSVSDTKYNRENFLIHDYFFAKTLDKVAPGGVVAFITSKGTLDKESPKVREYLAKRADLIGAIRLPNNAFKANAGTEVTADIIFLQKREKMSVEKPDWCYTAEISEGISVNQYFINHPEMILGKMQLVSGRYGEETACVPIEGANLKEQLDGAVMRLRRDIITARREEKRSEEHGIIPATADVRNFTFTEVNDKIYFRENNIMREIPFSKRNHERMRGMIGIRNTFRELVDAQAEGCTDDVLGGLQARLNAEYDAFVLNFGHISDIENRKVFAVDDDYNTLCGGLELINPETKEVTKADVFTKRTIKPYVEVTHVDTPQEALFVALDMRGFADIDYMAELCGTPNDEVIKELTEGGFIYKNPETEKYEEAAEYLSGYVRDKLRKAQDAAADNPEYERNVAALEKTLPPKLGAGDISVRLGASWISIEDYCKFFREYAQGVLSVGSYLARDTVLYRSVSGEYKIENKNADKSVAALSSFGTKRMNSYTIFENLLNNRDIAVYDSFDLPDGKKKRVMNKDETQLAQEKARQMKEAFPKWLWSDPERREKYVEIYNELFNSLVGREYDGSHQTFPGMNPFIELTEHQKNAVMRCKLGGNTLLAHCVGAGKTFEMAAAVMEKHRLGLINKACIVVPKHLVGQMSAEWLRLYPEARLLTAKENDFNDVNRQKFIGRCCTGDYDAVIMSYQQFQKIPMSIEYQQEFLTEQLKTLTEQLHDFNGYLSADEKRSVKDLERMKKNVETKLKKLLDTPHDNSLNFEQLGFDCIVTDEAHNYKNGLVVTKMKNVSGIGSKAAKKSEDFLMKTRYLNEKFGERNLILASGTPVSNSMTELYIMQQYLRPSALRRQGLQNFDDWASTFGEVVSQLELKPAGDGFRMKKRFAKFNNLPELMQAYKDFADIRTAEMLNLPVPEIEGGKPQVISAKPNEFQQAYMKVLAERSEAIHNGSVDPSVDNMLKITNEARLLGLDARTINPDADNYPNSKVNLLIAKVMEIYTETTPQKGVQAIFCDIAINDGKKDTNEINVEVDDGESEKTLSAEEQAELLGASKFSVYKYVKEELIRRGIPESEICFAGDAKDQGQRGEMYAQLRAGTKRIVLASTTKMGTGANIQTRLCALHNLDIPWKPSDFEQRIGRIVRQGNNFPTVKIFNYVTEGTFDAYMLNLIVTKQKFISQLMSGKTPARTCEDVDEMVLNYSEMQAIASGDPRIKEKIQLDTDVSRLRLLENEHLNKKYQLEDKVTFCKAQISIAKKQLALASDDKEFAEKNVLPEGEFKIIINGKIFTERKEAGAELRKAQMSFLSKKQPMEIGEYRGFKLSLNWGMMSSGEPTVQAQVSRSGGLTYSIGLELMNDLGNVTRIENVLKFGINKRISELNAGLARNEKDLAEALRTKDVPFEYAAELEEKSKRLAQLDAELGVGKKDEVVFDEDESQDKDHGNRDNDPPEQKKKPKRPKH